MDNTLPEAKLGKGGVGYTVPANPQDLDRVIAEARKAFHAQREGRRRHNNWKIVLLVGNMVVLVGALVILVIRYRRRKAARP